MKNYKFSLALVSTLMILGTATAQISQNGWQGPARDGIFRGEKGLLNDWSAGQPTMLWSAESCGKGYSSPTLVGDRLYITGLSEDGKNEVLTAFSATDGKQLWQTAYGTAWDKTYPENRTTPTVVGDRMYVISGIGEVVCLTTDGKVVWTVDGGKKFQNAVGPWGTSESPLVYDNKVIYTPCGEKTTMVALDATTGETIWESPTLHQISGYVSPQMIIHNGVRQIIQTGDELIFAINPDNGKVVWTEYYFEEGKRLDKKGEKKRSSIFTNTPLYDYNGKIYITNGYDQGSMLLKLNSDASKAEIVWRNDDLDVHHGGVILLNNVLYGSSWIDNNKGNWVAVDYATGKTLWETPWEGGKGKGSIISADGKLYIFDERRGFIGLMNPSRDKFDVVSEFRITMGEGPFWSHPVISNGILYVRHGSALMAFKIK